MTDNEFRQPVSVDFAPKGSVCEWCGEPAVEQLTAIGGKRHNKGGFFCRTCGDEFIRAIAESLTREASDDSPTIRPDYPEASMRKRS